MFNKIKNLLSSKDDIHDLNIGFENNRKYEFNWLAPNFDNLCTKDILDIRTLTQQGQVFKYNKNVIKKFTELRKLDGRELKNVVFDLSGKLACNLNYPSHKFRDGVLFKAITMDEKWDIFLFDNILYFSRSLSGHLVFKASISVNINRLLIESVNYAQGDIFYDEPALALGYIHFLMMTHVLEFTIPHPIPTMLSKHDPMGIALFSYNQFGRKCWFATKESILDLSAWNLNTCKQKYLDFNKTENTLGINKRD